MKNASSQGLKVAGKQPTHELGIWILLPFTILWYKNVTQTGDCQDLVRHQYYRRFSLDFSLYWKFLHMKVHLTCMIHYPGVKFSYHLICYVAGITSLERLHWPNRAPWDKRNLSVWNGRWPSRATKITNFLTVTWGGPFRESIAYEVIIHPFIGSGDAFRIFRVRGHQEKEQFTHTSNKTMGTVGLVPFRVPHL